MIRGALSGALLGIATSLALGAAVRTGQLIVGALTFELGCAAMGGMRGVDATLTEARPVEEIDLAIPLEA